MKIKLTYGLKENTIVRIEDVESGLGCNCLCPACGARLVAKKKGEKKAKHFAHYNQQDCGYQAETELHYRAKQIFEQSGMVSLPEYYMDENNKVKERKYIFLFDSIVSERKLGSIIPDLILFKGNRQLLVEIAVTHFVDDVKRNKINELKIPVVEIDLSEFEREFDEIELQDLLTNEIYNKIWIYNEKKDEAYKRAKEERIRLELKKAEDEAKQVERKEEREKYYMTKLRDVITRDSNAARYGKVHHVACPLNKRIYNGNSYANVHADCCKCEFFRGFRENRTKIVCLKRDG